MDTLADLTTARGIPNHIRLHSDPEFAARAIMERQCNFAVKPLVIESGHPLGNQQDGEWLH